MNTAQRLCVVCSKCNECAMDLECLRYCDPSTVLTDSAAFVRNGFTVIYLYRRLYPALRAQNAERTSVLSLYLEILLRGLYSSVKEMDAALAEFSRRRDREAYYRRVLRLTRCTRHEAVELLFRAPGLAQTVELATLNDVERLLCKINYVYGALDATRAVEVCRQLLDLLARLCDTCPVASPEVYRETATCFQCYEELMAAPNQGRSIRRRMRGLLCDHISVQKALVQLDSDAQTLEQDAAAVAERVPRVRELLRSIRNLASFSPASSAYLNDAEEALRAYHLFSAIPERIYSLSDYTYWSKTSEAIARHVGVTLRQLNVFHALWKTLRGELSRYLYGEELEDVFSLGEDRFAGDARLFVGSIFAAPARVVDMISSMSVQAFESNPLFNRLHESNEMYAKIQALIEEIREEDAGATAVFRRGAGVSGPGVVAAAARGGRPLAAEGPAVRHHRSYSNITHRRALTRAALAARPAPARPRTASAAAGAAGAAASEALRPVVPAEAFSVAALVGAAGRVLADAEDGLAFEEASAVGPEAEEDRERILEELERELADSEEEEEEAAATTTWAARAPAAAAAAAEAQRALPGDPVAGWPDRPPRTLAEAAASALVSGDPRLHTHDVTREVNVRRRSYLKKVSEVGYSKVMACIRSQEHLLSKLVNVNLVGTVPLEALSRVMNGFLSRRRITTLAPAWPDVSGELGYDEHLYVTNNLMHRRLPAELLPLLAQDIYRLINGPLFSHDRDRFPQPYNINMAYACDNAGVLPHLKEDLVRCAEGTVYPHEWMVTGYLGFFRFDEARDLNDLQKRFWEHVRELVLSVALFNDTFAKRLIVWRVEDGDDAGDGLVLTYEGEAPLLLRHGGTVFRSRDLYLLLYRYLALDAHGAEGPAAAPPPSPAGRPSGRVPVPPRPPGDDAERVWAAAANAAHGRKRRAAPADLLDLVRGLDTADAADLVPASLYE